MLTLPAASDSATELPDGPRAVPPGRTRLFDAAVVAVYVLGGLYLSSKLWIDLEHRAQASNPSDHGFFLFVLSNAAHSVLNWENPLFSHQLNVPNGVNMMANTSILAWAIPLVPVTVLFGVNVSYALLVMFSVAATATAWYYVLSRYVVTSRWAAFIGAALCGFAPGFVSQANGHPNVAGQFMVPLILLQVARLRDTRRPVRTGVILGLMITYQAFINEEVLLFAAVTGALMAIVWALSRRNEVRAALRPGLTGLGVGAGVAGALLAYPLYFQFFGPQHYEAVPARAVTYYSDLGSYVSYATRSLAGSPFRERPLFGHLAEQNSYFGWPLLILALVIVIWLRRNLLVRIAATVGVFFALMSLGTTVRVYGVDTGVPGPFAAVNWLPLIESVVPVRLALMVGPALGVLVALGLDRVIRAPRQAVDPRWIFYAAFAGALLPLLPTPLPTKDVPAAPRFVTAGTWRSYVAPGQSVFVAPGPSVLALDAQRWSAQVNMDMPVPSGYFLGPGPGEQSRALYGAPLRPTQVLLQKAKRAKKPVVVTDAHKRDAVADLKFWRAAVVIVGEGTGNDLLRLTITDLLGPAQKVDGVWLWDVRPIVNG